MTKPTGRPRGRPKTKEYVTLMARVPLDLAEQARRYAGRKQQPISEVLRDGLQLLMEQEADVPYYVYDRNPSPAKVSDTKEDTALTLEAPVARQPAKVSDTKEAPLPLDTPRPAMASDIKEDSLPMETPPVKVSDTKEAPLVLPFDTSKYHLSTLCKREHDYEGTGQSLLNAYGGCLMCDREKAARRRAEKKATKARQALAHTPA